MTDAEFARAFERGDVTPDQFDHTAHMRVAWTYLRESPSTDAALGRMREAIKRFAAAAGKSDKYHETITVAWMILLADVRVRVCAGGADRELTDVLREHPALADKDVLLRYYSRERLFDDRARVEWIEPDRAPLYCPRGEAECGLES
jgi:hypothetical protein